MGDLRKPSFRRYALPAGVATWVVLVTAGMSAMWAYSTAPGRAAEPPAWWPGGGAVTPERGKFNLLVFLHPGCPCSRATVEEVGNVIAARRDRVAAHVVMLRPDGMAAAEADRSRNDAAAKPPGARVVIDAGGAESRRFGSVTSGQVLLYDPAGRLAFAGGVTPARGHAGDNFGRDALLAATASIPATSQTSTDQTQFPRTPVFGCPLFAPDEIVLNAGTCPDQPARPACHVNGNVNSSSSKP